MRRCNRDLLAIVAVCILAAGAAVIPAQEKASAYRAPRTVDGRPDLGGIWQAVNSAAWDVRDHSARSGVPAGLGIIQGGEIPYLPWASDRQKENLRNAATADPLAECFLPGVPRATYLPFPFQIAQTPATIAILYEWSRTTRIIYMDGTPHPEGLEFWMGDSRGRWEGETLVVDVTNFNGKTWLDKSGNFHSEELHVVERYTRTGPDHLQYEVTLEDPKVFARPWTMSMPLYRRLEKNVQVLEYECLDFLQEQRYKPTSK